MAGELTSFWLARGRGVVDTGLTPAQGGGVPLPGYSFLTDQKSNGVTTQNGAFINVRAY